MQLCYDNKVDALRIKFNNRPYYRSQEIIDGVNVDLTEDDESIAIEILYAATRDINPYEVICQYFPPQAMNQAGSD